MPQTNNNKLKETIKHLEEVSAEKEEKLNELQALFHRMDYGIAFFEPITNNKGIVINCRFIDINPAYEKMIGIQKNDIVGKNILTVLPEMPIQILEVYNEVFQKNESKSFDFLYTPSQKYFSVNICMLNETKILCAVFSDTTEYKLTDIKEKSDNTESSDKNYRIVRKKLRIGTQIIQFTNQRLRESEERFRTLIENSPDMIFRYDKNYRHVYVSPNVSKILGRDPNEMLGKTSYELDCSYSDSLAWREKIKKVFKEGVVEEFDVFAKNKKGEKLFLSWKLAPEFIENNKVSTVLAIARDITIRKQAEDDLLKAKDKAEEAEKLKSAFLANMSHEIRTPMNGILGFSELLTNDELPPDKRKLFSTIINNNGKQLLRIIDDIIDVSKLEAGEIKIVKTRCSLNTLLDELLSLFRSDDKTKKSNISIEISKGLSDDESIIFVDEMRLRQVLINLIDNAMKFTKKGSVHFGYEPIRSKSELQFHVKDTGIGIPEKEKDIIFKRFRQVDETIAKDYGGTGLGLPISKGFVDLMGGRIWFEDNKEGGSIFYFTIPYRPVKKPEEDKEISSEIFNQKWEGKTILVVEDEESSFVFLDTLLTITGINLLHAKNGQEAIDMCYKHQNIDLILMDIQLPVINGYEATKKIKKFKKDIPIIAQTAYALSGEKEKSIKAGCSDYLTKPINRYLLFEKLSKFLNP